MSKLTSKSLASNIGAIKSTFKADASITYRSFKNNHSGISFEAVFVESMVSKDIVNKDILRPLINSAMQKDDLQQDICSYVIEEVLIACEIWIEEDYDEIVKAILSGDTAIFVEDSNRAIVAGSKGFPVRAIAEPETEKVVLGPREGFNESINTNISLIRRRLKHHDVKFVTRELGEYTKNVICICYIEGIAEPEILKELNSRLEKIHVEGIFDSGYLKDMIKDAPKSIIPTIGETERPDIVAAKLLEGRIAVLCDGSPFALTLPYLFVECMQSNEDYYDNYIYATFNRVLRYLAFFLTTGVPAIYVAIVTYHQEILPTQLLLSISSARQGVPFPTIIEALLMLTVFEILREAGVRLPKPIGQTISIVGALVLGQAAVEAKFISAPMVIITAVTGISIFMIPKLIAPALIFRYFFLLLAALLGLYGYINSVMLVSLYLFSLRSFGVPYMLKLGSAGIKELKDIYIRAPLKNMGKNSYLSNLGLRRGK